jgi:hypothetical protein
MGSVFLASAGQQIAANGLPQTSSGWVVFGLSILSGVLGLLGKA